MAHQSPSAEAAPVWPELQIFQAAVPRLRLALLTAEPAGFSQESEEDDGDHTECSNVSRSAADERSWRTRLARLLDEVSAFPVPTHRTTALPSSVAVSSSDSASAPVESSSAGTALLPLCAEVVALAWEHLHRPSAWRTVQSEWRELYCAAQLATGRVLLEAGRHQDAAVAADMALLFGGTDAELWRTLAFEVIEEVRPHFNALMFEAGSHDGREVEGCHRARKRQHTIDASGIHAAVHKENRRVLGVSPKRCIGCTVAPLPWTTLLSSVAHAPSLPRFFSKYLQPGRPVLLRAAASGWPAVANWEGFADLDRLAGFRTVPVEVGDSYTSKTWTQNLMTLHEFITKYVCGNDEQIGYLAQVELFEHIPELQDDFFIPEFCALRSRKSSSDSAASVGGDDDDTDNYVKVQAWIGPGGTVSPAHTDEYDNIFVQIMGCKRWILFPPEASPNMYALGPPHENTSAVDVLTPDMDAFPNFAQAQPLALECLLRAGDMLFIPRGWWHYVKATCPSLSASYWFNSHLASSH